MESENVYNLFVTNYECLEDKLGALCRQLSADVYSAQTVEVSRSSSKLGRETREHRAQLTLLFASAILSSGPQSECSN